MKKDKKNKKSSIKEVKDSKKEIKKKIANEEKKLEVAQKKIDTPVTSDVLPVSSRDYAALKKNMTDCAGLYQSILILPRIYSASDGEHSLYPSELKALKVIGDFSPINLTHLANKLGISKSAVSKSSNKLLEKELITKNKSETNIREVIFMLSATGQSIYGQLEASKVDLFQPVNAFIEELSPSEISQFQDLFSNLCARLTKIYEDLQK